MNNIDKILRVVQEGKEAEIARSAFGAILSKAKQDRLNMLGAKFKMGNYDSADLIAALSVYYALDDLEREIDRKITKGSNASAEIHKE